MARKSRQQRKAQISPVLDRRLNLYSLSAVAAGVGFLALTVPVDAEIIYSPAYKRVQGTSSGAILPIDFNHDGSEDVHLFMSVFTTKGSTLEFRNYGFLSVVPDGQNQVLIQNGFAGAVPFGKVIGPSTPFAPGIAKMAYCGNVSFFGTPSTVFGFSSGLWVKVNSRYLGMKIIIQGQVHYGWARFTTINKPAACAASATLTGYAYETIPNKSIIAGETTGSPDAIPADDALPTEATGTSDTNNEASSLPSGNKHTGTFRGTLGHLAAGVPK